MGGGRGSDLIGNFPHFFFVFYFWRLPLVSLLTFTLCDSTKLLVKGTLIDSDGKWEMHKNINVKMHHFFYAFNLTWNTWYSQKSVQTQIKGSLNTDVSAHLFFNWKIGIWTNRDFYYSMQNLTRLESKVFSLERLYKFAVQKIFKQKF